MNTYLKLKKILKHKLLSNFLITKGYIVNKIHNTNEEVSFHKEKLNQDFINVLVKDWNFSNKDHCYLQPISENEIKELEINNICPLCNQKMHTITEVYGRKGHLGLQTGKCSSCGFVKHIRNFNKNWYENHFNKHWLLCDKERESNVTTKDLPYDEVFQLLKPNSDVADIGCGIGDRLKKFKDNGINVYGCDPSNHRTKIASDFLNSDMKTMGGEEFFAKNTKKFDLVYFYTCLHFTDDPFFLIKEAAKSLKKNSYIYIIDSRYGYHNIFHASHLGVARSYLSIKSMLILAEKLGLKIIKYDPEPFHFILTNNKSAKNCKLDRDLDIDKYVNSELYPQHQTNHWLKVNYEPFDREVKFSIINDNPKNRLKSGNIKYPIKFISYDYDEPLLMLK